MIIKIRVVIIIVNNSDNDILYNICSSIYIVVYI